MLDNEHLDKKYHLTTTEKSAANNGSNYERCTDLNCSAASLQFFNTVGTELRGSHKPRTVVNEESLLIKISSTERALYYERYYNVSKATDRHEQNHNSTVTIPNSWHISQRIRKQQICLMICLLASRSAWSGNVRNYLKG